MHFLLLLQLVSPQNIYAYVCNYSKFYDQLEFYRFMLTSLMHEIHTKKCEKTLLTKAKKIIKLIKYEFDRNISDFDENVGTIKSIIKNFLNNIEIDHTVSITCNQFIDVLHNTQIYANYCYKKSHFSDSHFKSLDEFDKFTFITSVVDYLIQKHNKFRFHLENIISLLKYIVIIDHLNYKPQKSIKKHSKESKTTRIKYNFQLIITKKYGEDLSNELEFKQTNSEKEDIYLLDLRFYLINLFKEYKLDKLTNFKIYSIIPSYYINFVFYISSPYFYGNKAYMIEIFDLYFHKEIEIEYFSFKDISESDLKKIFDILAITNKIINKFRKKYEQIKKSKLEFTDRNQTILRLKWEWDYYIQRLIFYDYEK